MIWRKRKKTEIHNSDFKAYCSYSVIFYWSACFTHNNHIHWINCVMNYFQVDSAKPCCWHWWFLTIKTCNEYSSIWKDIPGQITHNSAKPAVNRCRTTWQEHLQFECSWKERQHCTGIAVMDCVEFFQVSRLLHYLAWFKNCITFSSKQKYM